MLQTSYEVEKIEIDTEERKACEKREISCLD